MTAAQPKLLIDSLCSTVLELQGEVLLVDDKHAFLQVVEQQFVAVSRHPSFEVQEADPVEEEGRQKGGEECKVCPQQSNVLVKESLSIIPLSPPMIIIK